MPHAGANASAHKTKKSMRLPEYRLNQKVKRFCNICPKKKTQILQNKPWYWKYIQFFLWGCKNLKIDIEYSKTTFCNKMLCIRTIFLPASRILFKFITVLSCTHRSVCTDNPSTQTSIFLLTYSIFSFILFLKAGNRVFIHSMPFGYRKKQKQIKDKNYGEALKTYFGEVLLVGVNYNKKSREHVCRIERILK